MSMPNYPRAVGNPRELPELRAALLETAVYRGPWHAAETQKLLMDVVPGMEWDERDGRATGFSPVGLAPDELEHRIHMAVEQADNTVRWYREQLPVAQLIHVTPEMTDFIVAAADAVPPDMTLTLNDAPAPTGLVVFGKPVYGTDAGPERGGGEIRVDGVMWGEAKLPGRDVPWYDERSADLRIASATLAMFRMIDPWSHTDELAQQWQVRDRIAWLPLGRTDWPWGDRLDVQPSMYMTNKNDAQWDSMMEDRRLMAALWAVLNQKRLIDSFELQPDRYTRKRLERAGHGGRDERVHIIHLRRTEAHTLHHTEGGRRVTVRFMVRPHYRRQAYGPGRSLRRIVLVPAHWRGPEDAPVSHAERIWQVDR